MSGNEAENRMDDSGVAPPVSPDQLMKEIRARTREEIEKYQDERKPFVPKPPEHDSAKEHQAGALLQSHELSLLNKFCAQSEYLHSDHLESHRSGLIGKLVTKTKKRIHNFVLYILEKYIGSQRDFQVNLVRHLNNSAKYIDGRDMANFWELIRKIDVDVQRALDRIERIADEQTGTLRTQEKWVNDLVRSNVVELKDAVSKHSSEIQTLDGVARGLESLVSRAQNGSLPNGSTPTAEEKEGSNEPASDYSYLLLENRYRGSEESITERLKIYPEIFQNAKAKSTELPVLEIGPGRGELLTLFRDSAIPAYGVDIDKAMVEAATEKGLDARLGDGIAHLGSLEDRSLSGLIAVQVVEHLTREQLQELFALCLAKVVPGGRIIFETINPRSLLALSSNYFRDPTHIWPLHPDTLEYSMNLAGLKSVETRFLSEVEQDSQLRELPVEEFMSPRLAHTIQTINRNFEQLNALLYGYQDYCIVAEVPDMAGER